MLYSWTVLLEYMCLQLYISMVSSSQGLAAVLMLVNGRNGWPKMWLNPWLLVNKQGFVQAEADNYNYIVHCWFMCISHPIHFISLSCVSPLVFFSFLFLFLLFSVYRYLVYYLFVLTGNSPCADIICGIQIIIEPVVGNWGDACINLLVSCSVANPRIM